MEGSPEMDPVSLGEADVGLGIGEIEVLSRPGDMGGEILGRPSGEIAREFGVGGDDIVPDEGLEITCPRVSFSSRM